MGWGWEGGLLCGDAAVALSFPATTARRREFNKRVRLGLKGYLGHVEMAVIRHSPAPGEAFVRDCLAILVAICDGDGASTDAATLRTALGDWTMLVGKLPTGTVVPATPRVSDARCLPEQTRMPAAILQVRLC